MESHRENHSKQVNKLRDEIQQQHDFIQQLKEYVLVNVYLSFLFKVTILLLFSSSTFGQSCRIAS